MRRRLWWLVRRVLPLAWEPARPWPTVSAGREPPGAGLGLPWEVVGEDTVRQAVVVAVHPDPAKAAAARIDPVVTHDPVKAAAAKIDPGITLGLAKAAVAKIDPGITLVQAKAAEANIGPGVIHDPAKAVAANIDPAITHDPAKAVAANIGPETAAEHPANFTPNSSISTTTTTPTSTTCMVGRTPT